LTQVLASGTVGVTTSGVNRTVFYKGSAISNVVEDPSPQLGADLDMNGQNITGTSGEIRTTAADAGSYDIQGRNGVFTNSLRVQGATTMYPSANFTGYQLYETDGGQIAVNAGATATYGYLQANEGGLVMVNLNALSGATCYIRNPFNVTNNMAVASNLTVSGEIRTTAADAGSYDGQFRDLIVTNNLTVNGNITASGTIIGDAIGFSAEKGTTQAGIGATTWTDVTFDNTTSGSVARWNSEGNYATNTSIFTAPRDGLYTASAGIQWANLAANSLTLHAFSVITSGPTTNQYVMYRGDTGGTSPAYSFSKVFNLSSGDTIHVEAYHGDGGGADINLGTTSHFSVRYNNKDE